MLGRLALAIGPFRHQHLQRLGEPDGLGGIARKGDYQRLLLSEWLMASEEPLEFDRRAAMGEHAFLELATRNPQGSPRSMVLFDAGPFQLGAPRIVHLAMLVVLAARAERGGASFTWAMLQGEKAIDGLDRSAARTLMLERSTREVHPAQLQAWLDRLGVVPGRDDLWLVGDPALEQLEGATSFSRVLVEDPLEPAQPKVHARVRAKNRPDVELELALPEPPLAIRLIRDPLRPEPELPGAFRGPDIAHQSPLLFTSTGHLLARTKNGRLFSMVVPMSKTELSKPVRAKLFEGEELIAAGWHERRLALITKRGDQFWLRRTGRRGGQSSELNQLTVPEPLATDPRRFFEAFAMPERGAKGVNLSWVFQTAGVQLCRVHDGRFVELVERKNVIAAAGRGEWMLAVARVVEDPEHGWGIELGKMKDTTHWHMLNPVDVPRGLHFCSATAGYSEVPMTAALQVDAQNWDLHPPAHRTHVPEGCEVVGLTHGTRPPSLVAIAPERQRLVLVSGEGKLQFLPTSTNKIVQAASSPYTATVAWLTDHDELMVHSLLGAAHTIQALPRGAP